MEISNKGFRVGGENNTLVANGTFFNSSILPGIGYDPNGELGDNKERKKLKLPDKKRMADVNDSTARMNTYISRDADWVTFEATVSTSPNQIAIAPGYLQREWQENDRRYFHYKMDSKILNFYSFLSADYQVKKDKWKDVTIEIYYQKGHEYNLDRMIKATKLSLDYFTQHFSPYQHRQVRIIEFPRYASFAQSFPNTIPYSESIGFIAKVNSGSEEDIDYPFYVTAHEVAHQWWAHQVIGGNVQGSTVMSETMSQYAALMVMEKAYGRNQMKRFLKYELDNYLQGRSGESEKELPLYRVENQTYIHYQKGSLVMYALRDYIGEENLNKALAAYIKKTAFQEAPYTNSLEFLSFIKQATPDSLQYLVKDMFEEITLYENRITNASYTSAGNGIYKVALQLNAKKFIADSLGYEKEQPFHDWVEIGVFAQSKENSSPLYIGKHRLKAGENNIEILVKEKPERAGIDPYFKLVDRNPEDNIMRVSER
jgi:aminopeptidase N